MQTRRRFLRDLGTGLLMAAAPAVVLAEPERKQWFVPNGAPVPSRADRFAGPNRLFVRVGGVTHEVANGATLQVGPPPVYLDRQAEFFGLARAPGELDHELRGRLLDYVQRPPMPASTHYLVDNDELRQVRAELTAGIDPTAKLVDVGPEAIKRQLLANLECMRGAGYISDGFDLAAEAASLRVEFKL